MHHPEPEALSKLTLFQRVSAEDRQRVAAASRLVAFARGEPIFAEGDVPDSFLTVIVGRVKIYKRLPNGKEIILQIFSVGDLLGAVAAYEGRTYPATAQAIEETTCLQIARPAFLSMLEQSPTLLRGVLSSLTMLLIELTDRVAQLSGPHVDARFARLFLKLADQFGRAERGGTYVPFPLSRQELADLTGTTIETCIRIMSRWNRERVLLTERDGFVILNRAALDGLSAQ